MEIPFNKGQIPKVVLPIFTRIGEENSAFTRGSSERRLRVVVHRQLPDGDSNLLDVVRTFAAHPLLIIYSTDSRDGPHIELEEIDEGRDVVPVVLRGPDGDTLTGVPSAREKLRLAKEITSGDLSEEQVARLLFLASASFHLGTDALATGSEFLLTDAPRGIVARSNPMTLRQTVALIGLFLRSRGDFVVEMHSKVTFSLDRGLFYWVLARELLPAGWRWCSACVHSSFGSGDDTPELLGASALARFDRTLRARDRLQEQFQVRQTNNTMDEALFYLDVALLELAGAFDAVARVAHLAYGLSGGLNSASWRRDEWRDRLARHAKDLADLMDDEQPTRDVFELIALLRNSIHGAALQGIAFETLGKPRGRESLVLIPSRDEKRFQNAVARIGGDAHWGVRRLDDGSTYLDPHEFVEAIVPAAAVVLDLLMSHTDVERLPAVEPKELLTGAPDQGESPFSPANRARVRSLAGF